MWPRSLIARRLVKNLVVRIALAMSCTVPATVTGQSAFTLSVGWMGDLTTDGTFLYMTTMDGFRPIIKIDPTIGAVIATIPQTPGLTANPRGAAFGGADRLFLTSMTPAVYEFETGGTPVSMFTLPDPVPNATEGFRTGAIAFDGTHLYVGDVDSPTIIVTSRSGEVLRHFNSNRRPDGMAFDLTTGNIWVVDIFAANKMSEMSRNGELVRECDIQYAPGAFGLGGIALIGSRFYVAEPLNPADPGDGTRIHVLERHSLVCNPPLVRLVDVDIKPGSFPNSINLESAGVIPVAILSSASFDATQVDPATVTLAGAAVKLLGKGDRFSCSAQDVNGDNLPDLVCHIRTSELMIEPGDSTAVLEAQTFIGEAVRGQDAVSIVP